MPFYHSYDIIDLLESRDSEGRQLSRLADELGGARSVYISAKDFSSFATLMASFTDLVSARNKSARDNGEPLYAPELHISSHGCKDGINWKDGSLIDWETLRVHLLEFASKLEYIYSPERNWPWAETASCIHLSLSCCYAAHASEYLFKPECYACVALIGPTTEIDADDCARVYFELLKFRMSQKTLNDGQGIAELRRICREVKPSGPAGTVKFFVGVPNFSPNPNFQPPPGFHPNDPIQFARTGTAPGVENKAIGGPMKKSVPFKAGPNYFSATATGVTVNGPTPDGFIHLHFTRFTSVPERLDFEGREIMHEGQRGFEYGKSQSYASDPYHEIIASISLSAENFASLGPMVDQLTKFAESLKRNDSEKEQNDKS